jgi:carbamoyltransferase
MNILGLLGGVSINHHDPGAALIRDGKLVCFVEEERLIRVKSARGHLPIHAIAACLDSAGLTIHDIDRVAHPGSSHPDMAGRIAAYLRHYFGHAPAVELVGHQEAHLASAFFGSGFPEAMCLSYDGYGDRLSAALAVGGPDGLRILETRDETNSLGLFYQAITSFLGFTIGEDEYKVMGLAAHGKARFDLSPFARPAPDGYVVDPDFLRTDPPPLSIFEAYYGPALERLVGMPPRIAGRPFGQEHRDLAFAAQKTLEECAVRLVEHLHRLTGQRRLCLAGGVALNCVANMRLKSLPFVDELFVQPAASDRGLPLGAALLVAHRLGERIEPPPHAFLGPIRPDTAIEEALRTSNMPFRPCPDPEETAAEMIARGRVVAWYRGRSEFGPRALGHRSILADPRPAAMRDIVNAKIKFRESFRPFAPAVLAERASELFEMTGPSPYMTVTHPVRPEWQDRLGAITHVDGTARVQTVDRATLPEFHRLISAFAARTGVPAVMNTSFNVRGQPIVETPLDALATFAGSGIDALFLGPCLLVKEGIDR